MAVQVIQVATFAALVICLVSPPPHRPLQGPVAFTVFQAPAICTHRQPLALKYGANTLNYLKWPLGAAGAFAGRCFVRCRLRAPIHAFQYPAARALAREHENGF